jgi:hypothetical protein
MNTDLRNMKLTKNVISRAEALKLAPDYVKFVDGNYDAWGRVLTVFNTLKRGQKVLTFTDAGNAFVICKVTSMNSNDYRAVDGPVVRVGNGEFTWRVDGDRYAYPI